MQSTRKKECLALTVGSCLLGFGSIGLENPEETSSEMYDSVESFLAKLGALEIYTFLENAPHAVHGGCNFVFEMRARLRSVVNSMQSACQASHCVRLAEHWKK